MNAGNTERLFQQARDTLRMEDSARDSLDARAQQLVQAAGLIIVIVGILKLPRFVTETAFNGRILFAFAFAAFLGMVVAALRVWWPTIYPIPGPGLEDENMALTTYLNVSEEENIMQVWRDYQGAADIMAATNVRKARWLKGAMALFLVQIAGLLGLALLA